MLRTRQRERLSVVRRQCRESIDFEWYDLLYTLQLFMSGDRSAIQAAMDGKVLARSYAQSNGHELPDYFEIMPDQGKIGAQNHGLINARINVEGLTMEPEFLFQHLDPIVRQVNSAFLRDRWVTQRWDEQFEIGGMEVEANGITGFHCGIDNQKVNVRHSPILDTLFDRAHKAPNDWKWVCVRNRLTPEEALEIYGDALTQEDLDEATTKEHERKGRKFERTPMLQVVEWCYYSQDGHVVFLKSLFGDNAIVLSLDADNRYRKLKGSDPIIGPNPYGIVPHFFWVDGWAPSVRRPVAKMETTKRLAALLNEVEAFMVACLREGPITAINIEEIDDQPELIAEIRKAKTWKDISRVLVVKGDINRVLSRTPAAEVPGVCLQLYSLLREQINAATGVGDMQRGQALGGERRTREEVVQLADASGVQARHLKRQFAHAVEDMVGIVRAIGAQYDTARTVLNLEDYDAIDTSMIPIAPFLREYLPCQVLPDSLSFKTDEDRRREVMEVFNNLLRPLIELRVLDPAKVADRLLRRWGGFRDPMRELGFSPQQQSEMAFAAQSQQQAVSS